MPLMSGDCDSFGAEQWQERQEERGGELMMSMKSSSSSFVEPSPLERAAALPRLLQLPSAVLTSRG